MEDPFVEQLGIFGQEGPYSTNSSHIWISSGGRCHRDCGFRWQLNICPSSLPSPQCPASPPPPPREISHFPWIIVGFATQARESQRQRLCYEYFRLFWITENPGFWHHRLSYRVPTTYVNRKWRQTFQQNWRAITWGSKLRPGLFGPKAGGW